MKEVVVNKQDLLKALQKNRVKHEAELKEAFEARTDKIKEQCSSILETIQNGIPILKEKFDFPMPPSHIAEYDRAIKMAEMHQEDTFTLSEHEFDNYVMDNWHWKGAFEMLTQSYKS